MTAILRARRAALAATAVLVAAASAVSFAESYRGLFLWAREHGLRGPWAVIWPLQVDVFIAVGELALFIALADRWAVRSRAAAWTVTLAGLAVSVAANVGHIASHSLTARATAAVPPLAAAAALAVGLGVLKRVVASNGTGPGVALAARTNTPVPAALAVPGDVPEPPAGLNGHGHAAAELFAAGLAGGDVPSIRAIRAGLHIGQDKARQVQAYLETLTPAAASIRRLRAELRGEPGQ